MSIWLGGASLFLDGVSGVCCAIINTGVNVCATQRYLSGQELLRRLERVF